MAKRRKTKTPSSNGKRTSLTRELLLEKAKPRFEWVEVEGFGRVGLRSVSQVQLSRRVYSYQKADGTPIPGQHEKMMIHQIIDQVCESESEPMFRDSDFDTLAELDAETLGPLLDAIADFNVRGGAGKP